MAEPNYRARIQGLAAGGLLDIEPTLFSRLRAQVNELKHAARFEHPDIALIAWEICNCRHCNENTSFVSGGRFLISEDFIADLALTHDETAYLLAHKMVHVPARHACTFATAARLFVSNDGIRNDEDIQGNIDESIAVNLKMAPNTLSSLAEDHARHPQ